MSNEPIRPHQNPPPSYDTIQRQQSSTSAPATICNTIASTSSTIPRRAPPASQRVFGRNQQLQQQRLIGSPLAPATIGPVPLPTAGGIFVPSTPTVYIPQRPMIQLNSPGTVQSDSEDESEVTCSACCENRNVILTAKALLLGQLMSLCLCGTGIGSELLAKRGFNAPAAQNFFNYFLLFFVYGLLIVWRNGNRNLVNVLRSRGWKYLILAFVDVQANYLIVYAYQFTNLTSIQILDCSTIPVVMLLSWAFLSVRYLLTHLIGVGTCLCGIALIIYADAINGRGQEGGSNRLLGDLLCLAAACLYGVANVTEEFLVKQYDRFEYLGLVGLFGCVIAGVQLAFFEHAALASFHWSAGAFLEYGLYTGCMFAFYSMVSMVMERTSALMFNLSVLTADFYSLLAGIFIFAYKFNYLYFVSFMIVILGSVVYSLRKTKDQGRTEARFMDKLCCCCCCSWTACSDCRPRAAYTVRDAEAQAERSMTGSMSTPQSDDRTTPSTD